MLAIFKNKKIIISFFSWLIFIFLFDLIIFLKKDSENLTSIETIFLLLTIGGGVISFIIFILSLEKLFHEKYKRVKASIFSSLSFIVFVIFGIGLIITPFIVFNKNKEIVKPTEASKNTLISSPLKLGSSGEDVKLLQAVLSTDKSIYPSAIISGYYGDLTKQAVINFQQKYNLSQTGELDQQTIDKFNEVYGDKNRDYYLTSINQNSTYSVNTSNNNTNVNNNYIDPDPLVNCQIHANCGGGTRLLKKSICDQSTCCQIGNSWIFYESKSKCIQDQNSYWSNKANYNYPTLPPLPTWAPFPTFAPLPTLPPFPTIDYSTPTPYVSKMTKTQCQLAVNDKYRSLMRSYGCAYPCPESGSCGGVSVCEVLWHQVQSEMRNCEQYP